jgi:hypothetical protein
MNKRIWMSVATVALLATVAIAGTMTPEEMTAKITACPNCKALAAYPELMPNLRPDIFKTESGFVSTFLVADAKVLPMCQKWEADCQANAKNPEMAASMCPVCVSYGSIMMNKDIKMESFVGSMGRITVATSTTQAGKDALHAHVALMQEASAVMPTAMAEIMKTAKPKTTTASDN